MSDFHSNDIVDVHTASGPKRGTVKSCERHTALVFFERGGQATCANETMSLIVRPDASKNRVLDDALTERERATFELLVEMRGYLRACLPEQHEDGRPPLWPAEAGYAEAWVRERFNVVDSAIGSLYDDAMYRLVRGEPKQDTAGGSGRVDAMQALYAAGYYGNDLDLLGDSNACLHADACACIYGCADRCYDAYVRLLD